MAVIFCPLSESLLKILSPAKVSFTSHQHRTFSPTVVQNLGKLQQLTRHFSPESKQGHAHSPTRLSPAAFSRANSDAHKVSP